MTKRRDAVLSAVQAAYELDLPTQRWLEGILAPLGRLGMGDWGAYTIDDEGPANFTGEFGPIPPGVISQSSKFQAAIRAAGYAPSPPVDRSRARWRRVARGMGMTIGDIERELGYRIVDIIGVLGCDALGRGVLVAKIGGGVALAPRTKRMLADLAAHVAAAYRLRQRLASQPEPEAVLSPSGQLLDGLGAAVTAREPLALAVKTLERTRLRRLDPDEAIASWTAMVEGRWSLVDHVERDGKRLVLAHRNELPSSISALRAVEARVATLAALGHSDKYIGYELGLQRSTVASHLRRALVKLRLRSRRDLIATYGPLARLSPTGGGDRG